MKLDFPRYKMRLGAVSTHAVQRIYELDSGKSKVLLTFHQTIKKFDYDEISNILHDLAIMIPIKTEKLKLLEGVLSGIPNECLVITLSNSSRVPIYRFAMEVEAVRQLGRFMDKRMVIVHQRDSRFAEVFKKSWLQLILDSEEAIRAGKAEGMVMGLLIAKVYHKDHLPFIDGDNYVPGAVNEYVKIFAAGFGISNTRYCNVKVSWVFKPKVRTNSLQFSKLGRVSETANKNLNSLLSSITVLKQKSSRPGTPANTCCRRPLQSVCTILPVTR
jgi:mannosyl-3-phosphoglycerate synthase